MQDLNEGENRPNILNNLINPLISVDHYTPKIQEDSIVVVFEVKDSFDAAYDLSSFIEKLPEMTLDTEARDTPNTSGNYEVFCEFERNGDFPDIFLKILTDVEKLANTQDWNVDVYGYSGGIFQLKKAKDLKNKVRLIKKAPLVEFLDCSGVNVQFLAESIMFKNSTMRTNIVVDPGLYFISEDTVRSMIKKYGIKEANRLRNRVFPLHEVSQFIGTDWFLVERDGVYLLMK